MVFRAFDRNGGTLAERTFYSIGGGSVVDDTQVSDGDDPVVVADPTPVRYQFRTGDELLAHASETGMKISDIVMANEMTWHTEEHVREGLLRIWSVMQECIQEGINTKGVLPGGLKVRRRAPAAGRKTRRRNGLAGSFHRDGLRQPVRHSGQRAERGRWARCQRADQRRGGHHPGRAALLPRLHPRRRRRRHCPIPAVAAGIGSIIKENASISGAEVGCQGEVGSACSMAAAD